MTLEAYCWPPSVGRGEPVETVRAPPMLRPSTSHVVPRGRRVRTRLERRGIAGRSHDTPDDASSNGCGWPPRSRSPSADWRSGYHAVTVTVGDERADAFLVVRPDPSDPAPILLVLSTTTWHAYNDWGGPSLYTGGTRVSFERPLARGFLVKPEPIGRMMQPEPDREAMAFRRWARPLGLSGWCGGAGWFTYERTFTRWAEANGYRVDVAISQDLEEHPEILEGPHLVARRRPRRVLVVGHARRVRRVRGARRQRGDPSRGTRRFWQVRFDHGHRAMTGYKYRADDDPVLGTADERFPDGLLVRPPGRPARDLDDRSDLHAGRILEVRTRRGARARGPTRCTDRNTGRSRGPRSVAGGEFGDADAIVAYECDGCAIETGPDGLPVPTGVDGAPRASRSSPPRPPTCGRSTSSRRGTRTSPAISSSARWPSSATQARSTSRSSATATR